MDIPELKLKTIKGISWNFIEKFGVQGVNFIFGIILARLLTPNDYGIIGIVLVFFIIANVFVESGLGRAYIQKKDVSNKDSNTIFIFNFIVSLIVYIILWFLSPLISNFYNQPILIQLIRVMGLVIIINAFSVIQIAHLTKTLDFKRKTIISLFAVLISGLSGIILALKGFGVWSLVMQNILNKLINAVGLWKTSKLKPRFQFSLSSFKQMYSYGSWLLFSSLITTTFNNIYILVIGKLFPIGQLGFYTKAKEFQENSSVHIVGAVGTVSFPIFSKLKDSNKLLANSVQIFLQNTLVILIPISIILIVVAKPFTILLLTKKWLPMVPFLQLLCIAGILYPIHVINLQLLLALGKSKLNFKLEIIKNILRLVNLSIAAQFGIYFIILGEVIISIIALIINTWYSKLFIGYGLLDQLNDLKNLFVGSIVACIIGLFVINNLPDTWFTLFFGILTTGAIYIIYLYIFERKMINNIFQFINYLKK